MALTAAERQQRRRERLRAGRCRLVLEIDEGLVDDVLALVGMIDSDDQRKVNAAFAQAVEKLARGQIEAALVRRESRVTTLESNPCYGDGDE